MAEALASPAATTVRTAPLRARAAADLRALLLVLPLLLLLLTTFVFPIGRLLWTGAYDPTIATLMPETTAALAGWEGPALPDASAYAAAITDLQRATEQQTVGQIGSRLNYETGGLRSVISRSARGLRQADPAADPVTLLTGLDKAWGQPTIWTTIKRLGDTLTAVHYLAAADLRYGADGGVEWVPDDERIYLKLFLRTALIAAAVTLACLALAFPLAWLLATARPRTRAILLVLVLLPLWTSLLVRTASWIVVLQSNGVLNDLLVGLGVVDDASRPQLVFNLIGTLIAMTHILLPFMVLPIYSAMRTIPGDLTAAAQSLGANRYRAFWSIVAPLSRPGAMAGTLLVFILAIGYYITPALLGGSDGVLISNLIAYHMQQSLNWGLAAALSGLLLAAVLLFYWLFRRLAGRGPMGLGA